VNTYSGSDYQISVQFMPVNVVDTDHRPFGLVGRIQDTYKCYWVYVYDDGTYVYLVVATYDGSSSVALNYEVVSSAHLDPSTWYTLSMTLESSTITGKISGGSLTNTTVTATDSTYTSGKVGILVWSGTVADYNVYFDNYVVTTTSAD
jgi:hypothetical protein